MHVQPESDSKKSVKSSNKLLDYLQPITGIEEQITVLKWANAKEQDLR